jgi:hypothetical protein
VPISRICSARVVSPVDSHELSYFILAASYGAAFVEMEQTNKQTEERPLTQFIRRHHMATPALLGNVDKRRFMVGSKR